MNVCDGDRLRCALTSSGWTESEEADADALIFITCSIRDKAEQKIISDIGRLRSSWEKKKAPKAAVIGCMAQRTGRELARRFPWISVVAGPRHLGAVPDALARALGSGERIYLMDDDPREIDDLACAPMPKAYAHKAYVTISHGCDQFCSYCIVPYVRGRFGSRAHDEILREVEALASAGTVEVTLLGQNVDSYGRDIGITFASLLSDVASISGIERVRFVTSHPLDFTDDIIDSMRAHSNICRSINLPVQSGNDKVLREMNRKYTRAEYLGTIGKIRSAFPMCGITTDLIVGFPGETEAEFEDSLSLLEEVRFDLVHSAAYSERAGTPASERTDQVEQGERMRRLNELNALQSRISDQINRALIGSTFEILIDEPAEKGRDLLQGRTDTDKVVLIRGRSDDIGTFANVRISDASSWCLTGERI